MLLLCNEFIVKCLSNMSQCLKITQNVAFECWHFPLIFVLLKLTCLVTLFDRKLQVFKSSPKWTILGIFNQLLSTQNVNVARFARNVKWYFFCDFQTLWNAKKYTSVFVYHGEIMTLGKSREGIRFHLSSMFWNTLR